MDNKELIKLFNKHVSAIGFKKTRNNVWYRKGDYVTECIYLQKSMFGNLYYFRYGYVINELELEKGYYYHYALTWKADEMQHIHDNLVAHPFVGYQLESRVIDAGIDVRAGVLASFDRERGLDNGKHTPLGFLGEVNAHYKRFFLEDIFYAGGHQQPFGKQFYGAYYWGDTYYQASAYNRTDVKYQFIVNDWVSAYAGAIFNVTKAGLNWHQVVTLRVNLGGSFGKLHHAESRRARILP